MIYYTYIAQSHTYIIYNIIPRFEQDSAAGMGALMDRLGHAARRLHATNGGLHNAFLMFDSNGDGYIDQQELFMLLQTCEPGILRHESDQAWLSRQFYCSGDTVSVRNTRSFLECCIESKQ